MLEVLANALVHAACKAADIYKSASMCKSISYMVSTHTQSKIAQLCAHQAGDGKLRGCRVDTCERWQTHHEMMRAADGYVCTDALHALHVSAWCLRGVPLVQGKVGAAFTSVGGHGRGFGGHEAILQSFHATFLQHGMARPGFQDPSLLALPFQASPASAAPRLDAGVRLFCPSFLLSRHALCLCVGPQATGASHQRPQAGP